MTKKLVAALAPALALGFVAVTAEAQQHKATRLGNPATRFAKSLKKPDDVRLLVRGDKTKADVAAILNEVGWKGSLEDLDRAAASAEITVVKIPSGTRLPFMASRKNRKPHALVDVLWAGRKPIEAFTFDFSSSCERYRFQVPHACSNFWIEDLGKDTTDPKCQPQAPPPPPVVSLSGASEACVTQPVEYTITVKNPPPDNGVTLYVNGKEAVSDHLTNGAFRFTFTGARTPGAYEVKAVSGGVTGTTTVQVKACVPTCGITATPLPAQAGKPFTVDLSGSRVAPGVKGGMKSAKVEVLDAKGAVVDTVTLPPGTLSTSTFVIKKGGIHTLRAVVTDEVDETSTNACTAQVDVKGGFPFFVGAYGGKERLVHDSGPGSPGGRCAALLGLEVGIQPKIGENTELEAGFGVKINLRDSENTSIFGDVAINRVVGAGFFGGGISAWDLTRDNGSRAVALLLQGGFDLSKDGKWQLVGQVRAPFNQFDDLSNNYQLWAGFRFRPNSWK
ncbi:MAG TPA: hypothetical protein VMT70_17855 [Vicinamibacteria bacterium]|nr:hypothetical protein [Vicinamibacteria bacterium]